jgi:transcriptional regulator with XRE-family HTH domain
MSKIDFAGFLHRKKITQSKLAKALGVTQANISLYNKGKSGIVFDKVEKLIDLGITPEELFGEIGGKKLRDMCVSDYLAEKGRESSEILSEIRSLRTDAERRFKGMEARIGDLEAKNQFRKPAGQAQAARETG